MEFRREVKDPELLVPDKRFEPEFRTVEYRWDPLTQAPTRINVSRAERVKQSMGEVAGSRPIIERSRAGCFFCPQNIEAMTPKFPPGLCPQGRIRRGECVLFPNLYPFAEYHAVAILSQAHYLELDEFTPEMLADNLIASQEYIASVYRQDEGAGYPVWVWNHLPPSGASIIHPHVQIMVDRAPMLGIGNIIDRSEGYYAEHRSSYWTDLIEAERGGERYIWECDSVALIASFAPRGNREVQFIFKEAQGIDALGGGRVNDFAHAVTEVLGGYKRMGVSSFNLVTYSAPLHERPEHFRMSARIIARPGFDALYTNDAGPLERFYGVVVVEAMPEDVAREMRGFLER